MSELGQDEMLVSLVLKRTQIKTNVALFIKFLDKIETNAAALIIAELQARIKSVEDCNLEFKQIQHEIEVLVGEIQENERENFDTNFFKSIGRAKSILSQNITAPSIQSTSSFDQNNSFMPNNSVKLPQIHLPEFQGSYHEWLNFHDTFKSLIHKNISLSDTEKFYYLKACLRGEAAQVVQSLEVNNANYDIAWNMLRERYENKKLISHTHVKALFDLAPAKGESHNYLRKLLDNFNQNLRALKALGQPTDQWDTLLIYMLTSKLDPVTKREWEESVGKIESPTVIQMTEFISKRCQLLETIESKDNKFKTPQKSFTHLATQNSRISCSFCKGSHLNYLCERFAKLTIPERYSEIKKHKICSNCLRPGHFQKECKSVGCKFCTLKHNSLLHRNMTSAVNAQAISTATAIKAASKVGDTIAQVNTKSEQSTAQNHIVAHCVQTNTQVLLATALIFIQDSKNELIKCRALLDSGSVSNFMTQDLADKLNLKTTKFHVPVIGINNSLSNISNKTETTIISLDKRYESNCSFLLVKRITENMPQITFNIANLEIPNNISLADDHFNISGPIDVLLGADIFFEILCVGQIKTGKNCPVIQKTRLGWIVSGSTPMYSNRLNNSLSCNLAISNAQLNEQLESFWKVENFENTKVYTKEENECEEHYIKTVKRDKLTGRYEVNLPLRENFTDLGDSEQTALKRFENLEKRLQKDSDFKASYVQFMSEYESLGHMTRIQLDKDENNTNIKNYLPHHGVFKETSTTTKLRVVFDASSKTTSNLSLNDMLKVGPTIQPDLFSILIQFRQHNYVFTGDIEKMYRQVTISKDQRDLQRIVWRANPEESKHYTLNTITYGTASAAFLAVRTLFQIANENENEFPNACKAIKTNFYVDDLISGSNTKKGAIILKQQITELLKNAGFILRKWHSNDREILDNDDLNIEANNSPEVSISNDANLKTLGLLWRADSDTLNYFVNIPENKQRTTKRIILSTVSAIFDPLGLIGPITIKAKLIIQALWQIKSDWDEAIPLNLYTAWNQLKQQLSLINRIKIPRQATVSNYVQIQLHGFSDSSERAFGCCIYIRASLSSGKHYTKLLCAKSRVAPLKTISLPRLELCGALLLAQFMEKVSNALDLTITQKFYWCDSTIALAWIRSEPSNWQTFIANRTAQIQELTRIDEWRHIPTHMNSADLISRGVTPQVLQESTLWWSGPDFLTKNESEWPENQYAADTELPEKKKTVQLTFLGARVWIPHPEKVWVGAQLQEDYKPNKSTLAVQTEDNEQQSLTIKSEKDLPFLRNPAILIGENDLTSLSYLHEPAVLHNLQVRFCQNKCIYTYCGIVLVAINPYDDLPIYDTDTIQTYRGQAMGDLDPHIFAVAEEAYTKLEREQRDQSIIVSGESGAGKTVSAKYAMRYFATVGGNATETQVEKKVLASSPIMEAIGNAKTTRNDNSSRFGKFIELQFSKQFHIMGASMRTYLLEKSRVVFQAPDERNYHIFYQLCSARQQLPHLQLDHQDTFHYLNQGQSPGVTGVDDLKQFDETVNALDLLGFRDTDRGDMFKILAGVLHLGNIKFAECVIHTDNEQDQEGCTISKSDKHLKVLCDLLEINQAEMKQWLVTRKLVSMRDIYMKPMSVEEAMVSRDALAKHIYAELFNWIVLVINKALESNSPRHKFIGVLDIYGFETFEINSFEQFCINYANEKLQQQFNLHVFKLEQEEYIKEGIEWKMIDFYDNQPCIDLIEAKLGVLDLLDEECKMPRGTDGSWTEKLYLKCVKYSHFSKTRFGGTASFIINHFADKVQYESNGFLEKNRDTVIEEQINVIKASKNPLLKRLLGSDAQKLAVPGTRLKVVAAKPESAAKKTHKKSVGSQFRDSLNLLMATLSATTPHYVRCIKPNDTKEAFEYEPKRTVQQLRACGVLETIRISAAGFPSRWTYLDFFYRYRVLCKFKDINRSNMEKTCENILKQYIKNADMYQFGKSKIFFRAGQLAYLEKLRADKLTRCCIMMQKTARAFIFRKKYLRLKKSVMLLQKYSRGLLARRKAQELRRQRAAKTLQRYIRGWVKRVQYQRLRRCIIGIQSHGRGYLARRRYMQLKYNAAALVVQKHVRGWLARRRVAKIKRQIVICQAAIRRFLARRQYKHLRIEARSIEHVKKLNKGLENKIISLQQKIDELNKTNTDLVSYRNEVNDLKNKLTTFKALEIEIKNLNNLLIDKNKTISKLEEELKIERDEKMDLVHEQEKYRKETEMHRELWAQETAKLRKEIDNINEIVRMNEKGAEENLKERIEEEKILMLNDLDSDRHAYQKLLQEYHCLEQHCEELEKQLRDTHQSSSHTRNISDVSGISGGEDIILNNDVMEDNGYGSVRSTTSNSSYTKGKLENIDWKQDGISESQTPSSGSTSETHTKADLEKVDVGLVLKLQHKLAEVEREKMRIQKRLDDLDMSPRVERAENAANDAVKISELELSNSRLKTQLLELQNSINEGTGSSKLLEQLQATQEELDRRTEEIIQLKSVLANQTNNMKTIVNSNNRMGAYINEDGELALAYETQKTINKQLELELQDEKAKYKAHEREYKLEIEKLRQDNERQQRILSANLTSTPQSQGEAFMQQEITRVTNENLILLDKNDTLTDSVRKLKKQVKILTKRLKEACLDVDQTALEEESTAAPVPPTRAQPSIRKKDREYLGMFAYRSGEENNIMKHLVIELKPRTAVALLPGLPAYIVFMCVRHTDYTNDEDKVKCLLSAFTNSVKKVIRKRHADFETSTLWLSNTLRLLHCMKQYSGDKQFQKINTPKQNDQCLRNFDLSEYRQVLSDIAVWIYQGLIRTFEEKVQPLIVPAILEHEEIPGISGGKPSGSRSRMGSVSSPVADPTQKPTSALLQELTNHYKILTFYGVDPEVISQVFKQVCYFICASSLNNLLLRKELCHWSKGLQIRHNLSHFEMWPRDKNLDETSIQLTLQPIIQASQLLQARKSEEDIDNVCEMCTALSPLQICKILNLYTPVDEFEQRVPFAFIRKVQSKLQERPQGQEQQTLLMDVTYNFPVRFPFNPSVICLEDIDIPEVLAPSLGMLEKL